MQRRRNANAGPRTSVKTQRKTAQTPPTRGANKRTPLKENRPTPQVPIGVSGVSLSNRFSTLHKTALATTPVAASKPKAKPVPKATPKKSPVVRVHVNVRKPLLKPKTAGLGANKKLQRQQEAQRQQALQAKQQQKLQKVAAASRAKRQQTVNSRRKGLKPVPVVAKPSAKSKFHPNTKAKPTIALKGKPKAKPTPPKSKRVEGKKKGPMTGEQLDVEMDEYWHEAGKGPDPKAAQLDRQMDEYWAGKPKEDAAEGEHEPASA